MLSTLAFLESGLNVCVLGPSDSGKSYLAKAIGIVACTKYRVGYFHCEGLLKSLVVQKTKDYAKFQKRLKKTCGLDLLVLDDFLLHTLTDEREVKLLFEILGEGTTKPGIIIAPAQTVLNREKWKIITGALVNRFV